MSPTTYPWTDRSGRVSPLRIAGLLLAFAPALVMAFEAKQGLLGARPLSEAIHQSGLWSIRLLAATLAVTPLRRATRWSAVISIRRILGLAALAYALLHLFLYTWQQHFDAAHIISEIFARIYLTIGFAALGVMCALGATSTDAMIARLGAQKWSRLHKMVYLIAVAATVHFFMQSKLDVSQPIMMGGIFALLLGYRAATRWLGDLAAWSVACLGAIAAAGTAIGEAIWLQISTGAPLSLVLGANFDFSYSVRPFWFVLGAGVILLTARLARPLIAGSAPVARRSAANRRSSNGAAAMRLKS